MQSNFVPIKSLWLKRFRSILGEQINFENPLFLVGKNGTGKSNVLKALKFVSECMTNPLETAIQNQGGVEAIRYHDGTKRRSSNFALKLDFDFRSDTRVYGWYSFEILLKQNHEFEVLQEKCLAQSEDRIYMFNRSHDGFTTNAPGLELAANAQALLLPLLGGLSHLEY